MIEGIFSQPNYVVAKKMLDAAAVRQQAIASNLANVEIPGYRRLDVNPSFTQELQQASQSRDVRQIASLRPRLDEDPSAMPVSRDGNTVKLENELIQLTQNFMEHSLDTQLITGALLRLRLAITGRQS